MAAISMDGVTKQFGGVTAVDGLDLTVEAGTIYGFLGPNGAGKSTTINMLLDFVRPTTGSVSVLGRNARSETVDIKRRVGVLPEGYDLYDRLTGREHVEAAIDWMDASVTPDAVLDRVGLAEAGDRRAGGYSKGMAQRLVLGMALVGEPDLLILDEPTTGLDPTGARDLREIVREENDRGATVFFSSHVLGQVEAVCDRVGIMRSGSLVAEDSIDGLRAATEGGATLTVTVDRATDAVTSAVRGLDGVEAVTVDGDRLWVAAEAGAKVAVIDAVRDAGAAIEDFETSEASLEDLFVSYTEEGAA
jgi:ABC-2 type transport system ATP-binding protein